MHLHGGGWVICRPEMEARLCRYLANNAGVVVVAPDYRKAPKYPYPHALEQCYAVASWIASGGLSLSLQKSRHPFASSLKLDTTRLALSGGSAGGNLAAALTTLALTRPLPHGTKIVSNGLLYPSLKLTIPYKEKTAHMNPERNLPSWASLFFFRAYLPPPRQSSDPFVSPALAPDDVLSRFPPSVILTAAYDYLAKEGEDFAKKLESLGVDVKSKRFEGVGHGFDGTPTRDKEQRLRNTNAREIAYGMIADVFRATLW
ncbi:Alpha/beta hydrolase fold-3 [Rickenella mellea]|uniref:Alpha/beta hydrolase fold-3 n=1 Tax=Rickenella mellea TaxID=50990 RepID=A0A4Y7Q248_9AGAM|nr:Alpha/beta hydrolase fold-3 [Rickenella mellea]